MHDAQWSSRNTRIGLSVVAMGVTATGLASALYAVKAVFLAVSMPVLNEDYTRLYGYGYSLLLYAAASIILSVLGATALKNMWRGAGWEEAVRETYIYVALYILYASAALIAARALVGGVVLLAALLLGYLTGRLVVPVVARLRNVVSGVVGLKERIISMRRYRYELRRSLVIGWAAAALLVAGDYYYSLYQAKVFTGTPYMYFGPGLFLSWLPLEAASLLGLYFVAYTRAITGGRRTRIQALVKAVYLLGILLSSAYAARAILENMAWGLPVLLLAGGFTVLSMGSTMALLSMAVEWLAGLLCRAGDIEIPVTPVIGGGGEAG